MEGRKVIKWGDDLFFFFFFKTTKIWDLFLPGKSISRREKNQENDFTYSEKYLSYASEKKWITLKNVLCEFQCDFQCPIVNNRKFSVIS